MKINHFEYDNKDDNLGYYRNQKNYNCDNIEKDRQPTVITNKGKRERSRSPPRRERRERSRSPPRRERRERSRSPPRREKKERSKSPQKRERSRSPSEKKKNENIEKDKNNKTPHKHKNPNKIFYDFPPPNPRLREYDANKFFSLLDELNNGSSEKKLNNGEKKEEKIEVHCKNPSCNHKTLIEDPTPIIPSTLTEINNIDDLITLGKTYHCKKNTEFNKINLRLLCNLVHPLTELSNLVGMKTVKENIVNHILFFIQGFNKNTKCNNCIDCTYGLPCAKNTEDMLHTVISGPPGVGKTELGKILAKVYKEMGVLSKGHFVLASRSDLIGKYLGHTAEKTQQKINEAIGGVLFIDEAYSLGHSENRDSFSKECIDTINQNLTEKRDLLVIIAGYEDQLEKCFFKVNEGLNRRFTFKYNIDGYDHEELKAIFIKKLNLSNWSYDNSEESSTELNNFFKTNYLSFPNFGGDIETFFLNAKIIRGKRMIFSDDKSKMLNKEDIEKGFINFINHRKTNATGSSYTSLWL